MFTPEVGMPLEIEGKVYRVAAHPAAPWMVYGQEGRAAIVYRLEDESGSPLALKVFKPRYRRPSLLRQAAQIAPFAKLPGLRVCERTVLSPYDHAALLRTYPDLSYAVLMPWIDGPTWMEVLVEKRSLEPEVVLALTQQLSRVLGRMEEAGVAHGDLSAANVMLPQLVGKGGVELVDVEGLYAPGLTRPEEVMSGSAGYAHAEAQQGYWGAEADRFAGAVLIAEMLGWCDARVREAAWGESYFAPEEVQQESERYRLLEAVLKQRWGEEVAALFRRAWRSRTLREAPTFGEWWLALTQARPQEPSAEPAEAEPEEEDLAWHFEAGQAALAEGDWEGAQQHFLTVVNQDPAYQRGGVLAVALLQEAVAERAHTTQEERRTAQDEIGEDVVREDVVREEVVGEDVVGEDVSDGKRKRRPWLVVAAVVVLIAMAFALLRYNKPLRTLEGHTSAVLSVAFSPDGETLASGSWGTMRLWGVSNGTLLRTLEGHTDWVKSVAFSPDGETLASGSEDNTVRLWRVSDGQLLRTLEGHTGPVSSVAFSPDGETLASGSWDNRVRLWRVSDGMLLRTLEGHTTTVSSVAFSPDGETMASGSLDGTVRLWRVSDGKLLRTLEGHTSWVYSVAFSPDGETLASGGADETVRLWRMSDGKLLRTLEGHTSWVYSVAFSPDGRYLASGSRDGTIRIWLVWP